MPICVTVKIEMNDGSWRAGSGIARPLMNYTRENGHANITGTKVWRQTKEEQTTSFSPQTVHSSKPPPNSGAVAKRPKLPHDRLSRLSIRFS